MKWKLSKNHLKLKISLLKHRLWLSLLTWSFKQYRKQSNKFVKILDNEILWASGIEAEETLLDQSQRIIEKRYKRSKLK